MASPPLELAGPFLACGQRSGRRFQRTQSRGNRTVGGGDTRASFRALWTSQRSLGTVGSDQWAIGDHAPRANSNGGSVGLCHVRGGLPWEESHSGSRHHSLPWGLWRMTDGPLMITAPLRISMAGPLGSSCSGGGCHVRRATPAPYITAFPGDYGE